jgi:deazaflavin-dependent oxidoreductase (nitroreductase family)
MTDIGYKKPGWWTRNIFNRGVAIATRLGFSVWGSRILQVRGRKSGEMRETPVNLLTHEGHSYLVAPRGTTQWVRNLRVSNGGALRIGRRSESFHARELADTDKPPILRAYLRRWKMEVGVFFGGVDANSSGEDLLRIAPDHPIFEVEMIERSATQKPQ